MKTFVFVLCVLAYPLSAAEGENYGGLSTLCGERAYKSMIRKLMDRNGGHLVVGGPRVQIPWGAQQLHARTLVDAASVVDSKVEIDEKDIVNALKSESAYWRVACLGVIWGRTDSMPSKSYCIAVAVNNPPTETELIELLGAWKRSR